MKASATFLSKLKLICGRQAPQWNCLWQTVWLLDVQQGLVQIGDDVFNILDPH